MDYFDDLIVELLIYSALSRRGTEEEKKENKDNFEHSLMRFVNETKKYIKV